MTGYYNRSICRACGGKCCKTMAGASSPEDFGAPNQKLLLRNLIKLFKSGDWTIDWWDGDPTESTVPKCEQGLFIRPQHKGNRAVLRDPSWGGECVFLTDKGCRLPAHKRPKGCRMLEPKQDKRCVVHDYTKQRSAIDWMPYHTIIEMAEQEAQG